MSQLNLTTADKEEILSTYQAQKLSAATASTYTAYWNTWTQMHNAFYNVEEVPVLPLTKQNIAAVASLFKLRGYSSFPNYLSCAKNRHIDSMGLHGIEWGSELQREYEQSIRSVTRGCGPPRQRQSA